MKITEIVQVPASGAYMYKLERRERKRGETDAWRKKKKEKQKVFFLSRAEGKKALFDLQMKSGALARKSCSYNYKCAVFVASADSSSLPF